MLTHEAPVSVIFISLDDLEIAGFDMRVTCGVTLYRLVFSRLTACKRSTVNCTQGPTSTARTTDPMLKFLLLVIVTDPALGGSGPTPPPTPAPTRYPCGFNINSNCSAHIQDLTCRHHLLRDDPHPSAGVSIHQCATGCCASSSKPRMVTSGSRTMAGEIRP